jgi:hypothetical protein
MIHAANLAKSPAQYRSGLTVYYTSLLSYTKYVLTRATPNDFNVKTLTSTQKQNPARSGASHLPKVELAVVYMGPFIALASIAMWMIPCAEKGSLKLRVGSVLLDIAILGVSLVAGFLVLPTMVILLMATSSATRAKGMQ